MRKIENIRVVQEILLGIAKSFKEVCEKNEIPYYMLGGTMLGAVRHKGFIPWDDDMDFGVPIEYYDNLIPILNKELPSRYKVCHYNNSNSIFYPYLKIEDTYTLVDDERIAVNQEDKLGINIDIFPLVSCNRNHLMLRLIRCLVRLQGDIFLKSTSNSFIKQKIKALIFKITPFDKNYLLKIIDKMMHKIPSGEYLHNIFGRWGMKECVLKSFYGEDCYYNYENITLRGFIKYDDYLKSLYNDYMKLPPPKDRKQHVDNIYYR